MRLCARIFHHHRSVGACSHESRFFLPSDRDAPCAPRGPGKIGGIPIASFTHALGFAALTATILAAASPSLALDIYEPDSPYNAAPNALFTTIEHGADVKAHVRANGAQLIKVHPEFANAIVTVDHGRVLSEVYLRFQRVLTLKGDDGSRASAIASALNRAHRKGALRSDAIMPARRHGQYVILAGREPLVAIDKKLVAAERTPPALLVLKWLDRFRQALGGVPFTAGASRGAVLFAGTRFGHASWYGPGFNGRRAADGERFNQNAMTAAHKTLPFGTLLLVTNLRNHHSAIVRVTDRGPYVAGRMLDLSSAAADAIGMKGSGVANVRIDVLRR